jgi:hypothetical protein
MAGVTGLDGVATNAARGLGLGLDGVAHHEVGAVHEAALEALRSPSLHGQVLRQIVAVRALRLRMTGLTELLLLLRERAVMAHEALVMAQERLREGSLQIGPLVARGALTRFPLLFMLVTGEALAHRRQRRAPALHDPRVTSHALPLDFAHFEVFVVIEMKGPGDALRSGSEHRLNLVRVVPMAARADRRLRELVRTIALRYRVAAVAIEASGLALLAALHAGEVDAVRKTWVRSVDARAKGRDDDRHDQRGAGDQRTRRGHRAALPAETSKA